MKNIIKTLQLPITKLLLYPLSTVLFGLIYGYFTSNVFNFMTSILLCVMVMGAETTHYLFHLKTDRYYDHPKLNIFLIISEAILTIALLTLFFRMNWRINLLLFMYVAFIHLQYFPFNFSGTIYQIILKVMFNGFILNCIALYSQIHSLPKEQLIAFIPLVFIQFAISLSSYNMCCYYKYLTPAIQPKMINRIMIISSFIAVSLGVYLSLPSTFYYLAQIIFVLLSIFLLLPIVNPVKNEVQMNHKHYYLCSISTIITLLYAIAYYY